MNHLEKTIAQIKDISLSNQPSWLCRWGFECIGIETDVGVGGQQLIRDLVSGVNELVPKIVVEARRAKGTPGDRIGKGFGFLSVNGPVVEFMHAPHVVVMGVRGDRNDRLFEEISGRVPQAGKPQPRIDEEVTPTTTHMPNVAADERIDVWLP